jgi:hypothetical protein
MTDDKPAANDVLPGAQKPLRSPVFRPRRELSPMAVFFTFLMLGPPLGFLSMMVVDRTVSVVLGGWTTDPMAPPQTVSAGAWLLVIAVGSLFSYLFGGLQALFVAIIAAANHRRNRFVRLMPALTATFAISLVAVLLLAQGPQPPFPPASGTPQGPAGLVLSWTWTLIPHFGATLLCWAILRWFQSSLECSADVLSSDR